MATLLMVPRQRKETIFRGTVSHLNNLTDNEMRIRYMFGRDSKAYIFNIVGDKLSKGNCSNSGKTRKFTNISANWPGSTHDSHIFNTSNLCQYLETNNRGFNRAHSSTRSIIERAFDILKRRFHVLHSEVRMKPEKVCRVFGACAVLHNIALTRNEPLEDVCGVHVQQDQPVQVPNFEGEQDGRHIREHIARVFFN
ncbi:Hypothetical predicted protein [Mytilus galloprovincialis]|uniref:DDE Tnp4 domain-containing protein n=1 Tax=Mytilus galloprovincialis TaxID=29158 RepID=A0A8B6E0E9_MYTGA|nr:Hypothetical predicted protein [Mytilus galloprovincialis]